MSYLHPFTQLGLPPQDLNKGELCVHTPIDGSKLAQLAQQNTLHVEQSVENAHQAFGKWREVPAPKRGELIREFANQLRIHKQELGQAVSIETGKILQEGLGEVQEMIDMCDFAVGLSRQLYGLTMPSERSQHRLMETWHPLGVVAVISAFNFPVAVWSWNFALAIVCGNSVVWKPSHKTPLCALICHKLFVKAIQSCSVDVPDFLLQVLIPDSKGRDALIEHPLVKLVSATGSTRMGKTIAPKIAARLGRSLFELGGNNAMIVTPSANLDMALRAIVFSAVGTAGQRCTTLRRLIVAESVYPQLIQKLKSAYSALSIGNPMDAANLVGPLIDKAAFTNMQRTLTLLKNQGAHILGGQRVLEDLYPEAYYVQPALAEVSTQTELVCEETFAPLLYSLRYTQFEDALNLHNAVPQGLSSCIFTQNLQEAEIFLSSSGSDCGLANVNVGPSGAEIGGAFGGEKDTGGGRESGSDVWKNYMRRATNTINYSDDLPLAQGITFEAIIGSS